LLLPPQELPLLLVISARMVTLPDLKDSLQIAVMLAQEV
jgi:hypothetical protein